VTKLKYHVNYNLAIFNYKTKRYEGKEANYSSLGEANTNRWKCEKCQCMFKAFAKLVVHKTECHSYEEVNENSIMSP
jgi:hypothetical protein